MAVIPAIYRKFSTRIASGFEGKSPGIVSRVEVFGDETLKEVEVSYIRQARRAFADGVTGTYLLDFVRSTMNPVTTSDTLVSFGRRSVYSSYPVWLESFT